MNRVRELRKQHNMMQKELAIALNITQPPISDWEHQKSDPSNDNLRKLADLFGVAPAYILCEDNNIPEYTRDTTVLTSPAILYRTAPQPHIPEETISDIVERVKTDIERNAGGMKLTTAEQQLVTEYRQLSATQKARVSAMIAGYLDAKYE